MRENPVHRSRAMRSISAGQMRNPASDAVGESLEEPVTGVAIHLRASMPADRHDRIHEVPISIEFVERISVSNRPVVHLSLRARGASCAHGHIDADGVISPPKNHGYRHSE